MLELDARFKEDIECDELDLIDLMMGFEEIYGIEIPEDEFFEIKTIRDLAKHIIRNRIK